MGGRTLAVVAVLALAGAGVAVAAPPTQERQPVDDTFTVTGFCAFPFTVHGSGRVLVTTYRDASGRVTRISERPNIAITVTNPANRHFLTDKDVGLDKAVFAPDGSARVLSTGIHSRVRAPSGKVLVRNIGLQILTFDAAGNLVDVEIRGGNFASDAEFQRVVCGLLG